MFINQTKLRIMKNYPLILILLLIWLISLNSCKKDDNNDDIKETINLGFLVPMEKYPEWCQELINGANMAISEINSAGGVLGKELKLVIADDDNTPAGAVSAANKLIDEENVVSLSLVSSSESISVFNEVMNTKDILMISPSTSSTEITQLDDKNLVWRTVPSDAFQGKIGAEYLKNTLNISDVAVLYINPT